MKEINEKVDKYVESQKKSGHGFEQESWNKAKANIPAENQGDAERRAREALSRVN